MADLQSAAKSRVREGGSPGAGINADPPQYLMARSDNWSKGNRKSKWKVKGFRPETDPDYFMYEVNLYPYSGYMGMQIAGEPRSEWRVGISDEW